MTGVDEVTNIKKTSWCQKPVHYMSAQCYQFRTTKIFGITLTDASEFWMPFIRFVAEKFWMKITK